MEDLTLIKQDYSRLKKRFEERESRTEDVHKIKTLENENLKHKQQLIELQETLDQARRQMLLREENYNKHFRNGGAADRVLNVNQAKSSNTKINDWMSSRMNRRFNYFKKSWSSKSTVQFQWSFQIQYNTNQIRQFSFDIAKHVRSSAFVRQWRNLFSSVRNVFH